MQEIITTEEIKNSGELTRMGIVKELALLVQGGAREIDYTDPQPSKFEGWVRLIHEKIDSWYKKAEQEALKDETGRAKIALDVEHALIFIDAGYRNPEHIDERIEGLWEEKQSADAKGFFDLSAEIENKIHELEAMMPKPEDEETENIDPDDLLRRLKEQGPEGGILEETQHLIKLWYDKEKSKLRPGEYMARTELELKRALIYYLGGRAINAAVVLTVYMQELGENDINGLHVRMAEYRSLMRGGSLVISEMSEQYKNLVEDLLGSSGNPLSE